MTFDPAKPDWSDLYDGDEYDDEWRVDWWAFLVVGCVLLALCVFAAAIWR